VSDAREEKATGCDIRDASRKGDQEPLCQEVLREEGRCIDEDRTEGRCLSVLGGTTVKTTTRTGWMIKDKNGAYYDEAPDFFEDDIESATIYDKKIEAQAVCDALWCGPIAIIKVKWTTRQVKESR